jgi:competence ComEA-like helix-hairpin-helix protein
MSRRACFQVLVVLGSLIISNRARADETSSPLPVRTRRLEGVVNINTATAEELQLLPGIGPAKVRNVMAYRRTHPFRTVEELVRIKGIGRKMVRRLRLHLAVSGPTTAQQVIRAVAPIPLPSPPPPPPVPPPLARPAPVIPMHVRSRLELPVVSPRRPLPSVRFPNAEANHCVRPP